EGVSAMVKVDKKYEPIKENAKLYDELYKIYCRIYESFEEKEVFKLISKIQERY
ncbi:unnamed protein product, partial [marine sediment metagenome]